MLDGRYAQNKENEKYYKKGKVYIKRIIFLFLIHILPSKILIAQEKYNDNAVFEIYSYAMHSRDNNEILNAIEILNKRIESGDSKIRSLKYNKAQLEYKIRKYEAAEKTLQSWNNNNKYLYLGTLYILLDKEEKGISILRKVVEEDIGNIENHNIISQNILDGLIMTAILANIDINKWIEKWKNENKITEDQIIKTTKIFQTDKNRILNSLWPK